MAKFSVLSKQCPVCNGSSVERIEGRWGFGSPTHHCSKCGADLKTKFTAHALWSIPVAVLTLAGMYLVVPWLQHSPAITGVLRAALVGGVVGLAVAVPANVVLRGVVLYAPQQ